MVPPWELAGFVYENGSEAPVCWVNWSVDYRASKNYAAAKQQQEMLGTLGGAG